VWRAEHTAVAALAPLELHGPATAGRSFRWSFHQGLLSPTGAYWLDDPPDVSCKDSTRQHAVDDARLSCKQRRKDKRLPLRCACGLGRVEVREHITSPPTVPDELRNADSHSGEPVITYNDEVTGSSPVTPTIWWLTSVSVEPVGGASQPVASMRPGRCCTAARDPIAVLGRFRVERRASGEASSVMARACASAVGMVARGRPWKVGSGAARTGRKGSASSAMATGRRGSAGTSRARALRLTVRMPDLDLEVVPSPQHARQLAVAGFDFYATYDGGGSA
jgi:hypothetical protein